MKTIIMVATRPIETDEDRTLWNKLKNEFLGYLQSRLPPHEALGHRRPNPIKLKLIASYEDADVGCIGLREESDETCEMSMLYVREEFRGKGIGKKLTEDIIKCAGTMGYRYMRLVTYKILSETVSLYSCLGFRRIDPYTEAPKAFEQIAVFMELKLA